MSGQELLNDPYFKPLPVSQRVESTFPSYLPSLQPLERTYGVDNAVNPYFHPLPVSQRVESTFPSYLPSLQPQSSSSLRNISGNISSIASKAAAAALAVPLNTQSQAELSFLSQLFRLKQFFLFFPKFLCQSHVLVQN